MADGFRLDRVFAELVAPELKESTLAGQRSPMQAAQAGAGVTGAAPGFTPLALPQTARTVHPAAPSGVVGRVVPPAVRPSLLSRTASAVGSAYHRAEHAVSSTLKAVASRLPSAVTRPVAALGRAAFSTYSLGQSAVEAVARQRGATPEQAQKTRKIAAAADLTLGAKAVPAALAAVGLGALAVPASFLPVGSMAYLAAHPVASARAAGEAHQRFFERRVDSYPFARGGAVPRYLAEGGIYGGPRPAILGSPEVTVDPVTGETKRRYGVGDVYRHRRLRGVAEGQPDPRAQWYARYRQARHAQHMGYLPEGADPLRLALRGLQRARGYETGGTVWPTVKPGQEPDWYSATGDDKHLAKQIKDLLGVTPEQLALAGGGGKQVEMWYDSEAKKFGVGVVSSGAKVPAPTYFHVPRKRTPADVENRGAFRVVKAAADDKQLQRTVLPGYKVSEQLTGAEEKSVKFYGGSGFEMINPLLRGQKQEGWTDKEKTAAAGDIANIRSAVGKGRLPANLTLWRGVGEDALPHLVKQLGVKPNDPAAVGKTFRDPAFVSTSLDKETAEDFGDTGYVFRVHVPEGKRGLLLNRRSLAQHMTEREALLPDNTGFKVLGAKGREVHVEMLRRGGPVPQYLDSGGRTLPKTKLIDPRTNQPMTRTTIGALGEHLFLNAGVSEKLAELLGEKADVTHFSSGEERTVPIDFGIGGTGIEGKTISAMADQKTAISKDEKARKVEEAKRLGLTRLATLLQSYDPDAGTLTAHAHVGERGDHASGIVSRGTKSMHHVGTFDVKDLAAKWFADNPTYGVSQRKAAGGPIRYLEAGTGPFRVSIPSALRGDLDRVSRHVMDQAVEQGYSRRQAVQFARQAAQKVAHKEPKSLPSFLGTPTPTLPVAPPGFRPEMMGMTPAAAAQKVTKELQGRLPVAEVARRGKDVADYVLNYSAHAPNVYGRVLRNVMARSGHEYADDVPQEYIERARRIARDAGDRARFLHQALMGQGYRMALGGLFKPQGTDTKPAMLPAGSFIVRRAAAERHHRLLDRLGAVDVPGGPGMFAPGDQPAMLTPGEKYVPPEVAARKRGLLDRVNSGVAHLASGTPAATATARTTVTQPVAKGQDCCDKLLAVLKPSNDFLSRISWTVSAIRTRLDGFKGATGGAPTATGTTGAGGGGLLGSVAGAVNSLIGAGQNTLQGALRAVGETAARTQQLLEQAGHYGSRAFVAGTGAIGASLRVFSPVGIEMMSNALRDLGAVLGPYVLPVLESVTAGIRFMADAIHGLDSNTGRMLARGLTMVTIFGGIMTILPRVTGLFTGLGRSVLGTAATIATSFIGAAVTGMTTLITTGASVISTFTTMGVSGLTAGTMISTGLSLATAGISTLFSLAGGLATALGGIAAIGGSLGLGALAVGGGGLLAAGTTGAMFRPRDIMGHAQGGAEGEAAPGAALGQTLAPLLAVLRDTITPLVSTLATVGGALVTVTATGLRPVVQSFERIVPVLSEAFLSALPPLAVALSVAGTVLSDAVRALEPVVRVAADAFGGLASGLIRPLAEVIREVLPGLRGVLGQFGASLTPLVNSFVTVVGYVAAEIIPQASRMFSDFAAAFTSNNMIAGLRGFAADLIDSAAILARDMGPVLRQVSAAMPDILRAVGDTVRAVTPLIGPLTQIGVQFVQVGAQFTSLVATVTREMAPALVNAGNMFISVTNTMLTATRTVLSALRDVINRLPAAIGGRFVSGIDAALAAIRPVANQQTQRPPGAVNRRDSTGLGGNRGGDLESITERYNRNLRLVMQAAGGQSVEQRRDERETRLIEILGQLTAAIQNADNGALREVANNLRDLARPQIGGAGA